MRKWKGQKGYDGRKRGVRVERAGGGEGGGGGGGGVGGRCGAVERW